jgi:hypothetical protein
MATGSHPHVNFAAKATVGPAELLLAPTTQDTQVHDLYTLGIYPVVGDEFGFTLGAGYAWWYTWGACYPPDYTQCDKTWSGGITGGAGVVYRTGHVRVDVRGQAFSDAPFDGALLFTIGLVP